MKPMHIAIAALAAFAVYLWWRRSNPVALAPTIPNAPQNAALRESFATSGGLTTRLAPMLTR